MIWITWRLTLQAHYRLMPNFNQGMEAARPVSPLNGSCNKVNTVVPVLLNCSGSLPIPYHVNGVSQRRRRGRGIRGFGAKETQPQTFFKLNSAQDEISIAHKN